MIVQLSEEEVEFITRVCKRAIFFERMGIDLLDNNDTGKCKKLLEKLGVQHEN